MRSFGRIAAALVLLLSVGCVTSKNPIGAVPTAEQEQKFKLAGLDGDWKGIVEKEPAVVTVKYLGQGKLNVKDNEKGNASDCLLYVVKDHLLIETGEPEKAYVFGLLEMTDDDHARLCIANYEAWKKGVESGELTGTIDSNKDQPPPGQPPIKPNRALPDVGNVMLDATPAQINAFFEKHKIEELFDLSADEKGALKMERVKH